ncbi:Membrane protein, suppressor for copper-sensitivity ScsD [hydrothermal vent metagenome]|uniref:Membrane protein, suppressor for copper-sensitivity ScsD n=1 Tax=hydrothermal vent metagenome TaxID=652676 RepID=A0A1W1BNT3_9ZZZZ
MKKTIKPKKIILQIILFIGIIFIIRIYQHQGLAVGKAPLFSSISLTKKHLKTDLQHTPILVNFWATWCKICELEQNNIENIAKDYLVLNIAIQSGTDAKVLSYAKKHNLNPKNIINDRTGTLANLYGVKATPTSFIINKSGDITFKEVGYTTELGLRFRLWLANL